MFYCFCFKIVSCTDIKILFIIFVLTLLPAQGFICLFYCSYKSTNKNKYKFYKCLFYCFLFYCFYFNVIILTLLPALGFICLFYGFLFYCFCLIVIMLTLFPAPSRKVTPDIISLGNETEHATAYGLLTATVYWARLKLFIG